MNNKKLLGVLIIVIALAIALTGCGEKPAAEVNGTKISQRDFDSRVDSLINMYESQGLGEFFQGEEGKNLIQEIKNDTLEEMIIHQILLQEAQRLGVVPDQSEVELRVGEIKAHLSEEDYQQALKDYNWTERDLENYFFEQLVEMAVYDEVTKDVTVDEQELVEFYQQYKEELILVRASHILVESEEEALEIIALLDQGADFADLAMERSIDTFSAIQGGDLDYFSKGRMVPEFEEASFNLPVGQFTKEPVLSDYGYHIIKVVDKKETMEQLREEIEGILAVDEKAILFNAYLEELLENANIVRNI